MKYRKKPVVIEAEQWFPGKTIDGVRVRNCEVRYSADGQYYYVTKGNLSCRQWLSVEATPGRVTDEQKEKAKGIFSGGYAQFSPPGEETYHRKVLAFAFFELKSGRTEPLSEESKLFLDFGCVEGWNKDALKPPQEGWIDTLEGTMKVVPGDWIITGVNGERYPCKPDIFEKTYELVGE